MLAKEVKRCYNDVPNEDFKSTIHVDIDKRINQYINYSEKTNIELIIDRAVYEVAWNLTYELRDISQAGFPQAYICFDDVKTIFNKVYVMRAIAWRLKTWGFTVHDIAVNSDILKISW